MQGTVIHLRIDRGFGFLSPVGENDQRSRHFFHCTDLAPGQIFDERLQDQVVEFDSELGCRGLCARNVRLAI